MAPVPAPRKRNRKRKRRVASSSSDSDSGSSSSSSSAQVENPDGHPLDEPFEGASQIRVAELDNASSESSESSEAASPSDVEDDASDSSSAPEPSAQSAPPSQPKRTAVNGQNQDRRPFAGSRSPSPPSTALPEFPIPPHDAPLEGDEEKAQSLLKERFKQFWMGAIVEGFKDDLEKIRKEPNMTTSRLSLLIDAFASGANVFSSSVSGSGKGDEVNEMAFVLDRGED